MQQNTHTRRRQHWDVQVGEEAMPSGLQGVATSSCYIPTSASPDDLCETCKNVNFDHLFQTGTKDFSTDIAPNYPEKLHIFGRINIQASTMNSGTSSCGLCKVFASVSSRLGGGDDANGDLHRYIYAISARIQFISDYDGSSLEQDTVMLGLLQSRDDPGTDFRLDKFFKTTGYVFPLQPERIGPHIEVRRVSRDHFDVEFARSCLDECTRNHKICKEGLAGHRLSSTFKVINCRTGFVVKAPSNCNYVALSYVWGATLEECGPNVSGSDQDSILGRCPKVIMDSVEVSITLGFEYLWVDRYCIDQLDETDKHNQIRQMDLIYNNSQITIIAAAGEGPYYGLPGVNGTRRRQQPHFQIGRHTLLSTLPHPSHTLSNSKWATRGWTFQEGLLSKRRLIFTEEQILFECNSSHFSESLNIPSQAMVDKGTGAFSPIIPPGAFEWKTPGSDPDLFMRYVSEFTKRELSISNDRLNAMAGIFHAFERSTMPVHQILGVPLVTPMYYVKPFTSIHQNLEQCLLIGLTWSSSQPGTRIAGLPSWSWAGWTGEVKPKTLKSSPKVLRLSRLPSLKDTKVRIGAGQASPLQLPRWEDLPDFSSKLDLTNNIVLHIETYTFTCSAIYYDEQNSILSEYHLGRSGHYPTIPLEEEDNDFVYLNWSPDAICSDSDRSPRTFTAILIGDQYSTRTLEQKHVALLYVEEHEGGYSERVGTGTGGGDWSVKFERWMKMNVERRTIKLG